MAVLFFSKGWKALRDLYGIRLGAWINLVYVGLGQFALGLKDRFGKNIKCPVFNPPMHFLIDRTNVQATFNNALPPLAASLAFRHDDANLEIHMIRKLSEYDVTNGFLVCISLCM